MATPPPGEITLLLRAAQNGDRVAFDEVYRVVYDELRALAHAVRARHRSDTLNTTALVHEAYLKLVPAPRGEVHGRAHFFGIAARAMRQVLVDAARRRSAARRGGGAVAAQLDESLDRGPTGTVEAEDILALDAALTRLEALSPRQANVIECRIFAGLSVAETALALGVSEPTVKRDWQTARAFLAHALGHS